MEWIEASKELPDNLEDLATKHRLYGEEVFLLVDGLPGIGIFMYYAQQSKTYLTFETLRTAKQTIDAADFNRVKWMRVPK